MIDHLTEAYEHVEPVRRPRAEKKARHNQATVVHLNRVEVSASSPAPWPTRSTRRLRRL